MGIFFVYILKSSVCLALFYLFYRLLLSKETFHRFNRVALLGVLVLSFLIPLVQVSVHEPSGVEQPFLSLEEMLLMADLEPAGVVEEASVPFPWRALVLLVYILGIFFFLGRHLWSLGRMLRLLRTSRREKLEGGITLFVHRAKVAPFSWMKMMAVSEEDLEENRSAILTHERAHIANRHSWDLLLAEGCIFFQWFNPAAWLLKQELQNIHEFEADEWVIENGIDAKTYQLLIIKKAVGARLYSIANSFNHSSLKKRITMMIKKKSNPWARLKYAYVLPLATVAVAAFARPEVSN
ncbi:MAG: M56 family metallopeptidase, partial [Bacteroidaceae bacterium]|nr:M56 family metallopeptidase [Bacteroidaceae bacterium]